jgi:hypothetical protein
MTVPIDSAINVASFLLAPDIKAFQAFLADAGLQDDSNPVCFESHVVSDDEGDDDGSDESTVGPDDLELSDPPDTDDDEGDAELPSAPVETPFDITEPDSSVHVIEPDEEHHQSSSDESLLLRLHHRFNHLSFHKLQHMARRGIIPKRLSKCNVPTCSACLYGKATRRPWRNKPAKNKVSDPPTRPGQVVAVDQMSSPTPGLIAQIKGFLTGQRYRYATVFVDHATKYGYTHMQKTQSAEETVEAKHAFERLAASHGVKVEHYHADNGIFDSKAWWNSCLASPAQGLTFAGVNAHHMNGRAERRIRELQEVARSMLLHAQSRWPSAVNTHLWPYAVRLAMDTYNEAPSKKGGPSPLELFSQSTVRPNAKHWQPFGCPCYVLNAPLQSAGGIHHKWKERSKIGVYLGRSPHHANSVALVLNLSTGHVSPQFHVAFDPTFQSVKASFDGLLPPSQWQAKCGFRKSRSQPVHTRAASEQINSNDEVQPQREQHSESSGTEANSNSTEQEPQQQQQADDDSVSHEPRRVHFADPLEEDSNTNGSQQNLRRSARRRSPVKRLIEVMTTTLLLATGRVEGAPGTPQRDVAPVEGELLCTEALFPSQETVSQEHPMLQACGATNDPDVLYYHEAMKADDRDQFLDSMVKEFKDQWDNGNFVPVRKSTLSGEEKKKILPAVWAMRRKRKLLTGEIYKWKSRLNLDGSKQVEGRDFWQTYAPVATWGSIRLQLTLALMQGWHTKQIDFVQAYPQAPIEVVQYLKWPAGIEVEGYDPSEWVLKVEKNVYGGKAAGRTWYKHLVRKLESIGFVRSKFDECVFYKGTAMYVLYTDDSILSSPDEQEIEDIIQQMKQADLDLTVEGDVADFLGVNITRLDDNSFNLTQPKLIDSILEDLGLGHDSTSTKQVPMATTKLLSRHPDSEPFDEHFHYRRAIGKLNFLEKSTRPDIAYAVHQCARFCEKPKKEHGNAVKWIGRYLLATRDKGYLIKPDPSRGLEVFCDADFAGAWDKELAGEDKDTARSRHGYAIMYAGVPILWHSQLQTEIALSSTESELIGLSMALRTAIPLMNMLNEMKAFGFEVHHDKPKVHCKVFEDNSGALEIAKVPKMRPRTKHINCKYFHFVSYVEDGSITLHPIGTADQPADMLTKALDVMTLSKHRKSIQGW